MQIGCMADQSIQSIINSLLAAKKTPMGTPSWVPSSFGPGELKLSYPLYIDGNPCHSSLEINAYPSYGNSKEKWRIKLLVEKCVWRIDYCPDDRHINSLNKPSDLHETECVGPHYHAWQDNERFCTHASLPDKLPNARIMPVNCRTFENSLRWFCGETNIELMTPVIDLPPRTRLL